MQRKTIPAYTFEAVCGDCGKAIPVYYQLSDFYEAVELRRCRQCGTLFCYTREDEAYRRPLDKQLADKTCPQCDCVLRHALVQPHKQISCCGEPFDLDDDYPRHGRYDDPTTLIEVYDLYS